MDLKNSKFIHYPRTGGRFVRACLTELYNHPVETGMTPASNIDGQRWGIIRNPFNWYVSMFHFDKRGYMFCDYIRKLNEGQIDYYWLMSKFLDKFDIGVATYCFIYFFCDWRKMLEEDASVDDLKPYIIADKIIKYEPNLIENIKKEIGLTLDEEYVFNKTMHIGESPDKRPFMEFYNYELIKYIKHKDRLLFKLYPEYECNSNKS